MRLIRELRSEIDRLKQLLNCASLVSTYLAKIKQEICDSTHQNRSVGQKFKSEFCYFGAKCFENRHCVLEIERVSIEDGKICEI